MGGGGWSGGGGGIFRGRVGSGSSKSQVRGNFHTIKNKKTSEEG